MFYTWVNREGLKSESALGVAVRPGPARQTCQTDTATTLARWFNIDTELHLQNQLPSAQAQGEETRQNTRPLFTVLTVGLGERVSLDRHLFTKQTLQTFLHTFFRSTPKRISFILTERKHNIITHVFQLSDWTKLALSSNIFQVRMLCNTYRVIEYTQ